MTDTALTQYAQSGNSARLPLTLRLALRDLRGGFAGFTIFLICIALGTGSIGAINSLSAALQDALAREGRVLLGGDAEASLIQRRAGPEERAYLASLGTLSEVAGLRAMARRQDGSAQQLIDLKAVDSKYPLYGEALLEEGRTLDSTIRQKDSVAVDRALLSQLNVKLGDTVTIGNAAFPISAIIEQEPDRLAAGPAFGSRVLLTPEALQKTGLVEPGSLVRWNYRLKLDGPTQTANLKQTLATKFPEGAFQVRDSRDPSPGVSNTLKRLTEFLTLVGLTAMLTGGIGVANAVSAFIERRRKTIATYKALGATHGMIARVFLLEIGLLAALGIIIGLALGTALPLAFSLLFGDLLPVAIEPRIYGQPLALAALFGVLTSVPFILWPLGRTKDIRAAELLRSGSGEQSGLPPRFYQIASGLAVLVLMAAAIGLSQDQRIAAITCGALLVIFVLFFVVGSVIRTLAARLPRPRRAELALAIANIGGPASLTRVIALSLGLGLTLLTAVSLIDAGLTNELKSRLPDRAPSHFFMGIPKQNLGDFENIIKTRAPDAQLTTAPMLRGRIVALRGVPSEQFKAPSGSEWVLNGDRGLTYAETLPPSSNVVEGAWWPANYEGEPLVSFEADIARSLGLKVGDGITVNVLGRNLNAKIANFRKVQWGSIDINFVMIFSPNTLRNAPFSYLATLTWPEKAGVDKAREEELVKAITAPYPTISAIRVRDALNAVNSVFEKVMRAVRIAGSVTLIMGALVVAGALITAQRRRIYEAVVLRTLGASKRRIILAHLIEYLLLAGSLSVVAGALGVLAAYLVITLIMGLTFTLSIPALLQPALIETIFVVTLGALGTLRVLSAKPAQYLRSE